MVSKLYIERLRMQKRDEDILDDLTFVAGVVGFWFVFTVMCL